MFATSKIFWPGMSADIRAYVESCDTCATYCAKQPEQPLQMHEVPERPWQKVGSDIFSIKGRNYLVTVDYYSQFIELDYLPETNSATVITKLKHHFARHGIPDVVVSDNGPQYASSEFQCFARHWNFQHKRIAPGNSRANGQAESAVKIIKNLMIKSAKSGDDPYIALLNLRNTPNEGMSSSPVQRLLRRRTQSVLPATPAVLKPSKIPVSEHSRLQWKRFQSAQGDCSRSYLPPLRSGDRVRMEPIDGKKEWRPASVTRALPHNNYEVWDGTRSFTCARKFLRKKPSTEPASSTVPDDSLSQRHSGLIPCAVPLPSQPTYRQQTSDNGDDDESTLPAVPASPRSRAPQTANSPPRSVPLSSTQTRSGRTVKAPSKLNLSTLA